MNSKKLVLVDGNSIAFRAFFAMHNVLEKFKNADGLHTNAIYAFNNMLDLILSKSKPTDMLVAFDAGKTTFRTKMYADYKGNRPHTPSEFSEQLPCIKELLTARGIKSYELANYEADDIIGTMARTAQKQGYQVVVVTGDRDLTQLVTDQITVAVTIKGVSDLEFYTPEHFQEKLGITPEQLIDLKALMGDNSDNYPGVTKVGEKTGLKLLKQYGSLENLYANLDMMKPSKLKEHLQSDQEQAFLSKKLATIDTAAPVQLDLADLAYAGDQEEQLIPLYRKLNFRSFLDKMKVPFDPNHMESQQQINYQILDATTLPDLIETTTPVSVVVEMIEDNYHTAPIIGLAFASSEQVWVSDDAGLLADASFKQWLQDAAKAKYVFDFKRDYVALHRYGAILDGVLFDVLLGSYLLDVNDNSNDLGSLAQTYGYSGLLPDIEFYGKGARKAVPQSAQLLEHLASKAAAIRYLQTKLPEQLRQHDQDQLFEEIELPLAQVLADMEIDGVRVDPTILYKMQNQLGERLQQLQNDIYQQAGKEFNINSSQQLSKILFEDLGLKPLKKTKTGYSTSVEVLEKLRDQAPIVADILNYRQVAKIQSTYVGGLLNSIAPDGRVHTRYLQTLTQTGRLSSVDPNLQNIPARLDEGRKIRQAFVPKQADWEIFSSDYSQIELRVLAHLSGDQNMQQAFKENYDIHAHTAMRIFGLDDIAEVTPNMRRKAKATNFGIVYGISDYGLAKNIGISRTEAAQFIQSYFDQYPDVKKYMDQMVQLARENGYVETIMHRRRYLPDIHARNFNLRSFAERTAMNTPIQGSAADIIKIAMINMQKQLRQRDLKARMLLQVHDELIFEAPEDEIPILEKLVPQIMDSAVQLDVPLKVSSAHGKSWYDAKG
ncbi:DNA polymerase I [Bombilactobacillus thymidiniphilus]|uniref:DNA polymerase I n=1 Tax=Bombilactobacillus thymidiniphilus TaxID=2923363 RepID=A0ABY4PCD0_9LACO|nr:DNA polymerase I [Bombilactobacillus thymidiniphilus]UQS83351.1 DNA polymerase I [Bombilactobacillus thymidiniphilus]